MTIIILTRRTTTKMVRAKAHSALKRSLLGKPLTLIPNAVWLLKSPQKPKEKARKP